MLLLSNEARAGEQKSVPGAPFYLPSFHLPACSNDNAHGICTSQLEQEKFSEPREEGEAHCFRKHQK